MRRKCPFPENLKPDGNKWKAVLICIDLRQGKESVNELESTGVVEGWDVKETRYNHVGINLIELSANCKDEATFAGTGRLIQRETRHFACLAGLSRPLIPI